MADHVFRYPDGKAYERSMGAWSRLAGAVFLDWLGPAPGLRWIDVGCGNGAFTELLMARCAPAETLGIDPSAGQLAYARERPGAAGARFVEGDAMALPVEDGRFDAATLALVIFFVPDPVKGLAEAVRVVLPGGEVSAYAWDFFGGGFPYDPFQAELRALGIVPKLPPRVEASRMEALRGLWTGAGLERVETRQITVTREFADFDDLWMSTTGSNLRSELDQLPPADLDRLKDGLRARLPAGKGGRIAYDATANAIRGRVPGGRRGA